jgi:hypothetical protein
MRYARRWATRTPVVVAVVSLAACSICNRDLWMHRLDLARATRAAVRHRRPRPAPCRAGDRDLALAWPGPPVTLELMEATMMFLDCPAWLDEEGALRCGLPAEVRTEVTLPFSACAPGGLPTP